MRDNTTQLLAGAASGDLQDAATLLPLVYEELKSLAAAKLRAERPGHTLQPTALVNEVYLRMVDQTRVGWKDRNHFFAVAAQQMRRVLIDHARSRLAAKRGGGAVRLNLDEGLGLATGADPQDIVAFDDLLTALSERNERHAKTVELRFFAGLGVDETAQALGVSPATVKNDWRFARAWLLSKLAVERDGE